MPFSNTNKVWAKILSYKGLKVKLLRGYLAPLIKEGEIGLVIGEWRTESFTWLTIKFSRNRELFTSHDDVEVLENEEV